MSEKI